jgi:hypothetical protein
MNYEKIQAAVVARALAANQLALEYLVIFEVDEQEWVRVVPS